MQTTPTIPVYLLAELVAFEDFDCSFFNWSTRPDHRIRNLEPPSKPAILFFKKLSTNQSAP